MAEKLKHSPLSGKVGRNRHAVAAFCFLAAPLVVQRRYRVGAAPFCCSAKNHCQIKKPIKNNELMSGMALAK
ncbi:hypothetical protein [Vogesella indigofera]|uniref:hypothetical protein n=1 Tax=Vogesella indigofera TaxID=45465 RepID=UPI00234EE23F|nr:hypothetical protein [Vogesella indigofera]MDC7706708.1 hypothetical protein [Vogesella indigofera]